MSSAESHPDSILRAGSIELHLRSERVFVEGIEVHLTPKAFALLRILLQCEGDLLTKVQIFDNVWPRQAVSDRTLSQLVYELRTALGEVNGACIQAVPRRGYRFVVPTAVRSSSTPKSSNTEVVVHGNTDGLETVRSDSAPADIAPRQISEATPVHSIDFELDQQLRSLHPTRRPTRWRWPLVAASLFPMLLLSALGYWLLRPAPLVPIAVQWLNSVELPDTEMAFFNHLSHSISACCPSTGALGVRALSVDLKKFSPSKGKVTGEIQLQANSRPFSQAFDLQIEQVATELPKLLNDALLRHQCRVEHRIATPAEVTQSLAQLQKAREAKVQGELRVAEQHYTEALYQRFETETMLEFAEMLEKRGSANAARLWAGFGLLEPVESHMRIRSELVLTAVKNQPNERYVLLKKLPATFDNRLEMAKALISAGEFDRARELLTELRVAVQNSGQELAWVRTDARWFHLKGDFENAMLGYRRCVSLSQDKSQQKESARCNLRIADILYRNSEVSASIELLQTVINGKQLQYEPLELFNAYQFLIFLKQDQELGTNFEKEIKAISLLANQIGTSYAIASAKLLKGQSLFMLGDESAALLALRESFRIFYPSGSEDALIVAINLAEIEISVGNYKEALQLIEISNRFSMDQLSNLFLLRIKHYYNTATKTNQFSEAANSDEKYCWSLSDVNNNESLKINIARCKSHWGGKLSKVDQHVLSLEPKNCRESRAHRSNAMRYGVGNFYLERWCKARQLQVPPRLEFRKITENLLVTS